MINITLLGTSCMVPTKERNPSAFYLEYNGEGLLFDCGEGTQRQMNIANINRNKVKKIFISHWHGDHVSGLVGLIQTINSSKEKICLEVFGPEGTNEKMDHLLKSACFDNFIEIKIKEIKKTKEQIIICETKEYCVYCISLEHGIPCLGYAFVEKDKIKIKTSEVKKIGIPDGPILGKLQDGKNIVYKNITYNNKDLTYIKEGKKISFVMDTLYTKNAIKISENSDLLICEATYLNKHLEKSEKHKHLTATQAALIANNSNSKKLIMTHFSQRYKDIKEIEEEARNVFSESYAGFDFMKLKI
jgi:ribonuclease Z